MYLVQSESKVYPVLSQRMHCNTEGTRLGEEKGWNHLGLGFAMHRPFEVRPIDYCLTRHLLGTEPPSVKKVNFRQSRPLFLLQQRLEERRFLPVCIQVQLCDRI